MINLMLTKCVNYSSAECKSGQGLLGLSRRRYFDGIEGISGRRFGGRGMAMKFAAGALPVFAAAMLGAMPLAMAEDAPATGVPEVSIAQNWNDPVRAAFAQRGITYGVNWSGEYWNVAKGGNSQGSNFDGLLATYTDIDLDKLTGWKGATIHASAYYLHGVGASTERVNNIFAVSNIEGLETFRLFELWFEQSLLQDKVKVRIGSLAADSEFFISDSAALFLNGTFGWPGVTAANMAAGGPGYPLASLGVRVQYAPTDNLTILAAVFNGARLIRSPKTRRRTTATASSSAWKMRRC